MLKLILLVSFALLCYGGQNYKVNKGKRVTALVDYQLGPNINVASPGSCALRCEYDPKHCVAFNFKIVGGLCELTTLNIADAGAAGKLETNADFDHYEKI